jgi:UDP-N-acetylmuramoyl-L-alanyl-D-glutamate--2,6-diaminopimelate ligase
MQTLHSPTQAAEWLREHVTGELCTDSRVVREGDAFIAWPGAATDGRAYVAAALKQGAHVCLIEAQAADEWMAIWQADVAMAHMTSTRVAAYSGLKAATGWIADAYYEQPSKALKVMAVTGTNGKTSTTWWLAQALNALSQVAGHSASRCAVVGTLGVGVPPNVVATGMTTPDPVLLQAEFKKYVAMGVTHCAIEASSIGIAEKRLAGTQIQLAVFTNFTQDHLDYHGTMAEYWQAKAELFAWPALKVAVINIDDAQGAQLAETLRVHSRVGLDIWTCSRHHNAARLQACDLSHTAGGLSFDVLEGSERVSLQTSLLGDYNVDNLLGVMAALRALGVSLLEAASVCATLQAVPGRMEKVTVTGAHLPLTVVDYAHTPDAVAQTLSALKPFAQAMNSQLWCVLGCGGDRDASKRPLMAAAAEFVADHVVLTSDNPRNELPEAIVADMRQGLKCPQAAHQELDRAKAIQFAVAQAQANDIVLIAGKGHEETQEIAGVKYTFDDRRQAEQALRLRASGELRVGVGV